MKKIILLFSLICFGQLYGQTIVPVGNVYGNWPLSGSPYLVQGHILVPNDSTLTIAPGVRVEFQGHYKLFCNGRILALGTPADTITFTVPASGVSAGWFGFRYDDTPITNDTSRFSYCKIQHGKATGSFNDAMGGAFFFNHFSKCIISHCYISNNYAIDGGGAIYCDSSSIKISNNTFMNQTTYQGGDGIDCENHSSVMITNNILSNGGGIYVQRSNVTITGNTISGENIDGGIASFLASTLISHNIIKYNASQNGGGGGGILLENSSSTIIDNIISNNSSPVAGGGISCISQPGYIDTVSIINNVITNNYCGNNTGGIANGGGGILCSNIAPAITNNTICNNISAGDGGGLCCILSANPIVKNTIIYGNIANSGNGNTIFLFDNPSDPSFNYCDLEGGSTAVYSNGNPYTGGYSHNISSDPIFISPALGSGTGFDGSAANWNLHFSSPCINKGDPFGVYPSTDIAGGIRVRGGIIDIGAYEFQGGNGIADYDQQNNISVYPNPGNGNFVLETNYTGKQSLELFDMDGKQVFSENITGQTSIDATALSDGMYMLTLKTADRLFTKKLIVIH